MIDLFTVLLEAVILPLICIGAVALGLIVAFLTHNWPGPGGAR